MIGILAEGRLGNQMFQFAFTYAAAKKLNTSFFIYRADELRYFQLTKNFSSKNKKIIKRFLFVNAFRKSNLPFTFNGVKRIVSYFRNGMKYQDIFKWDNMLDENKYFLSEIKNNKLYSGFFQCEEYFKKDKEDILKCFSIKEEYTENFREIKKYLFEKKYVAIHIRRTDYVNHGGKELGGNDVTLPATYYKKCLSLINNLSSYNVVFVSDDIEFAKNAFGKSSSYYYESNNEITDFQILLNADKLIIANSSFSWWAAWLSTKHNKIVYAPEYYLGFKIKKYYPAGIKVPDWNWVDVN